MTKKERYNNLCKIADNYFNVIVDSFAVRFRNIPTHKFRYTKSSNFTDDMTVLRNHRWHTVDALPCRIYYNDVELQQYDISSEFNVQKYEPEITTTHALYLLSIMEYKHIIKIKCELKKK